LGDWLVEVDGQPFHPIRSFEDEAGQELERIHHMQTGQDLLQVFALMAFFFLCILVAKVETVILS